MIEREIQELETQLQSMEKEKFHCSFVKGDSFGEKAFLKN